MTEEMKPRSLIWLCDVPFNNDYKHVLTFNDRQAQLNYFDSKAKIKLSKYTYVRKDSSIVVEAPFDEVNKLNYIVFSNNAKIDGTGYIFGFIINAEYVSENSTRIYYDTDVFQTHQFNIVYRTTFVEREHVSNDSIGIHTIPENVELGEYIINSHLRDTKNRDYKAILMSSITIGEYIPALAGVYNGIPSGYKYYGFSDVVSDDINSLKNTLQGMVDAGKQDAILSLFIAPSWLAGETLMIPNSNAPAEYDLGISPIRSLNGYTPRNKKLLTYPYCYILASNNQGNDAVLKQELWKINENNEMVLRVKGVLCSGCSVRAIPINYNGDDVSNINGITLGKFPQIGFACDPYINWLTENGLNMVNNAITGVTQLASGNISGISSIANALYSNMLGERIPPQITGNVNSGDLMTSMHENCFHAYRMTIKAEYAKIIDSYFDMYGYKVNELKEPDILSRPNWNYLKTINCNFTGRDIPEKDMETIKSIFDNGVTLWHHAETMYNYDANNSI